MDILSRLSKRERVILYAVIGIITLSLIYNFLIDPIIGRWRELDQQVGLLKIRLQKAIGLIKDKDKIEKEYAAYAQRLKLEGSDEQELTGILNELEQTARSCNVKIISMRPRPSQEKEYHRLFTVDIETESDMSSLMRFIYEVKNSQQLLKVDRLNLSTRSSQEGTIINASMSISKVALK